jgi:hypothetical protein
MAGNPNRATIRQSGKEDGERRKQHRAQTESGIEGKAGREEGDESNDQEVH